MSGGGPLGAIYEIGALCALEESLNGIDFTRLQHYVGVSAGGFIAAGLANGISPRKLCAAFIESGTASAETSDPSWLMMPAYGEFARRGTMLPALLISALWRVTAGGKPLSSALEHLGPALPAGLFSNEQVHAQLAHLFSQDGRTNDFRELKTQRGKVTPEQRAWLDVLTLAEQNADVWRPADLLSGRIARELAALAGLRGAA